jgi:hypothetical protein
MLAEMFLQTALGAMIQFDLPDKFCRFNWSMQHRTIP